MKTWQQASYHDVTLLAMEEISVKCPDAESARQLVQRAAQEFEDHRRGITLTGDTVTVVGK